MIHLRNWINGLVGFLAGLLGSSPLLFVNFDTGFFYKILLVSVPTLALATILGVECYKENNLKWAKYAVIAFIYYSTMPYVALL